MVGDNHIMVRPICMINKVYKLHTMKKKKHESDMNLTVKHLYKLKGLLKVRGVIERATCVIGTAKSCT